MTVLEDLNKIENIKGAIYDVVKNKGVDIPANTPFEQYPSKITSIPSSSGVDLGNLRDVVNGKMVFPTTYTLPDSITDVGDYALHYMFYKGCPSTIDLSSLTTVTGSHALDRICYQRSNLISVDLSGLTSVSGANAFEQSFIGCTGLTSIDLSSLTTVSGATAFAQTFQSCTNLTSVDLSSLTTVTGSYAFSQFLYGCSKVASINLSNLTTVTGNNAMKDLCSKLPITSIDLSKLKTVGASSMIRAFNSCTHITGAIDLSSLETVGQNGIHSLFDGCTGITSVNLLNLTTVQNYALSGAFRGCNSLTSMTFPSLSSVTGPFCLSQTFKNCTALASISFPALTPESFGSGTYQFNRMLEGVTGCTVHFPAAIQSVIGSWSDVINGFGGTNTTVLFDLV